MTCGANIAERLASNIKKTGRVGEMGLATGWPHDEPNSAIFAAGASGNLQRWRYVWNLRLPRAEYLESAMPLIGSRASFTNRAYLTAELCSECNRSRPAGWAWLVSIRGGKVVKRVCSEECRLKFDHHYWQGKANDRIIVRRA